LLKGFESSKSSSIHKTFKFYKDQKAGYRFFGNKSVKESHFIDKLNEDCAKQGNGRKLLAYCDTSTINTSANSGRLTDLRGLGIIGRNQNKESIGFFLHGIFVEDQMDGTPCGFSSTELYNRSLERSTFDKSKRDILRTIPIEEKESYKWVGPCLNTRDEVLKDAEHITFVMDREGDIIEVFERIPNIRTDVVVRNMHNRKIINEAGEKLRLADELRAQKATTSFKLKVNEKGGKRKSRSVTVEVKWGNIELLAPRGHKLKSPIKASYVEVKEVTQQGKASENPIHWLLLSSKQISSTQEALEIVKIYKRRWSIEVFFKLLKSDGFDIEKTEMKTGRGIRKLTLMIMQASIKILQLKSARTGGTTLKTEEVFTDLEIKCLEKLNHQLEGKTVKQQNPYSPDHLSWASWIIARLGGWTEFYNKSRPPGNKTFKDGLEKFETVMLGFLLSG